MAKPRVSVIIPNHNRDLSLTLVSIADSSYDNIETIIINEGKERSVQRNMGIDKAKGEYLLFLDSDQIISSNLIKECVYLMEATTCDGIYIPEIIRTKGIFGRIRNFERQFYTGTAVDVARFVRKDGCPKFDVELNGPEDSDWDRRLGKERLVSSSELYHYDYIGVKNYIRKKAYYTKSMQKFMEKNPNDKIMNFKYRCFTVFVENGKWKRLLRHPLLTLGIGFIFILRVISYFRREKCQK